jgi:hypothetical protein
VLARLAREKESLHWVTQGGYELSASGYHYGPIVVHQDGRMSRASQNGKVVPEVYLVPVADWVAHDQLLAAQWPAAEHNTIAAKASSLDCDYSP